MVAKNIKIWGNFGQLGNLIANIFGMKQCIVERKTVLQTSISLRACALNLVNFDPQTTKNRTGVSSFY